MPRQINADEAPEVMRLLSSLHGQFLDRVEKHSPQQCSIAVDGMGKMLLMARIGADWIDVLDIHHRASDGYSLVARSRELSMEERTAFASVCGTMGAGEPAEPIERAVQDYPE
jgi:hypothetical protein